MGRRGPTSGPGSTGRTRVLVVDDDDMMREALSETLVDAGFEVVHSTADGGEGVALAEELVPDVVLMDLRMAGVDGLEACRRIRAATPSTQVVILSAYDDPGLQRQARDAGAADYVPKGSSPGRIFDALRGLTGSRSA